MSIVAPITAQAVLDVERGQLGVAEQPPGSNRQPYGAWYGMDGVAWCDIFQTWCLAHAGWTDVPHFAATTVHAKWFQDHGAWLPASATPPVGSLEFFDWGQGIEHVGCYEGEYGDGRVYSIEGNTDTAGGASGGRVMRQIRSRALIAGFGVITYQEDNMPLSQADLDAVAAAVWGDKITLSDGSVQPAWAVQRFTQQDAHTAATMASKAAGEQVDPAAIAKAVLAGLDPKAIAAAIPGDIAKQVADELHNRMAS